MLLSGLIVLETSGISLSGFRQITGFIYLTFIPGALLFSILKPRQLSSIETFLCVIGLSVSFTFFFGVVLNFLLPLIGITKPLSLWPILSSFMLMTSFLTLIACKFGKGFNIYVRGKFIKNYLLSAYGLLPILIPFLAILSTFIVFNYKNNNLILINYLLIAISVLMVVFMKKISTKLYPLYLFSISLGLLWTHSLISGDIIGGDIQLEYSTLSAVINNSFWDPQIHTNLNAMLSITIMPPVYSILLGLSPVWLLKIIYSFLLSLVPMALFLMYKNFCSEKISFLSAFFFISFPSFFFEIVGLSRQEIAEFFIALSLLLIFSRSNDFLRKSILLLVFLFSIVVSHYTAAYLYLIIFGSYLFLLFLIERDSINKLFRKFKLKLKYPEKPNFNSINVTYVLIFLTFSLGWYMYISQSSSFLSVVKIGNAIVSTLYSDFFSNYGRDPYILQALGLGQMRSSEIQWQIARSIQYITQFLIIIGVYGLLTKYRPCFNKNYMSLVLVNLFIIILSIILPYFASKINMTRIFHVCLFILAPFCILGGLMIFQFLFQVISKKGFNILTRKLLTSIVIFKSDFNSLKGKFLTENSLKLFTVLILIPYFLFSSGFVFEITGATPTSMPLSLYKADWPFHTQSEIQACEWLSGVTNDNDRVYADWYGGGFVGLKVSKLDVRHFTIDTAKIRKDSLMFLRRWNIENGSLYIPSSEKSGIVLNYMDINGGYYSKFLNSKDLIYDNGNAHFLYYPEVSQ